jgi:hypothetical protein
MSNDKTEAGPPGKSDQSGENKLRGEALAGSERNRAADHTQYDQKRDPDKVVRVDGEEDTLYSDGLEVENDTTPMGTAGNTRIP